MFGNKAKTDNHENSGGSEERLTALFQPDTLINDQFVDTYRRQLPLEPEQRLIIAILEDGIHAFQDNFQARQSKKQRLFEDAESWIFGDTGEWIFSFSSVCALLNLDPGYLRRGLRQWQAKQKPAPDRSANLMRQRAA